MHYAPRQMVQAEEKSIVLIEDVMLKFSKRSWMMLYAFVGELSREKACEFTDKERRLVGYD